MKYKVVSNSHVDILEREVNELIKQGWKPIGGIGVAYKHEHAANLVSHLQYVQAMTISE